MTFLSPHVTSFCQPTDQGITEKVNTNIGAEFFSHLEELLRRETIDNLKQTNPEHFFLLGNQSFRAKRNGASTEKSFGGRRGRRRTKKKKKKKKKDIATDKTLEKKLKTCSFIETYTRV